MKGTVVTILADERLEMQAIALDNDRESALALVKRLLERILVAEKRAMDSPLDKKGGLR
jgi:hypothetical protein